MYHCSSICHWLLIYFSPAVTALQTSIHNTQHYSPDIPKKPHLVLQFVLETATALRQQGTARRQAFPKEGGACEPCGATQNAQEHQFQSTTCGPQRRSGVWRERYNSFLLLGILAAVFFDLFGWWWYGHVRLLYVRDSIINKNVCGECLRYSTYILCF